MKCISLWQPWASAIALGLKRIETRSWATSYRGAIAIHASARWTGEQNGFRLEFGMPADLPLGSIVATANLIGVIHVEEVKDLSNLERSMGDYTPGRYAWLLGDVKPLETPYPFHGQQGLFSLPDWVAETLEEIAIARAQQRKEDEED